MAALFSVRKTGDDYVNRGSMGQRTVDGHVQRRNAEGGGNARQVRGPRQ